MERLNHTGTDRLRKGRVSNPGARYFITNCTESRKAGLHLETTREALIDALRELHLNKDIALHCATVMPDHIHCLFTLGRTLTLSQTQGKFKSLTSSALEQSLLVWQKNYYDHRIRTDTFLEPFARYTFLNPYRKRLIPVHATWPGWVLNQTYKPEFSQHLTDDSYPPSEWLANGDTVNDLIEQDLLLDEVES
ncbi:REP-associated tyrosine transposase [Coraliomargarita sp. W4R53]